MNTANKAPDPVILLLVAFLVAMGLVLIGNSLRVEVADPSPIPPITHATPVAILPYPYRPPTPDFLRKARPVATPSVRELLVRPWCEISDSTSWYHTEAKQWIGPPALGFRLCRPASFRSSEGAIIRTTNGT
jgi:hypothetical protein